MTFSLFDSKDAAFKFLYFSTVLLLLRKEGERVLLPLQREGVSPPAPPERGGKSPLESYAC